MMSGSSGDRTMFNAQIAGADTGKATKGRYAE
jgi:hypothetical protein